MASIFTYDPNPPRVASPWLNSKSSTPPGLEQNGRARRCLSHDAPNSASPSQPFPGEAAVKRLDAEPQEGSTEYKLHLLLRPRRKFYSTTTGLAVSGSYHSKTFMPSTSPPSEPMPGTRPAHAPSNYARQTRLQQLTTQLLWRLQQSSPFHSSSTVNLVLPVLPEATPKLVPSRPADLLPGLEESQGALYEIGVSDDGTLVGLIEDELEESLTNLKAMAASLGCIVELVRKVNVGECEWKELNQDGTDGKLHAEKLWVAEALVRPDLDHACAGDIKRNDSHQAPQQGLSQLELSAADEQPMRTEQLRVTLTGCSTSGKSSLLGTLTTSILDNGRGKSRLSLLRHRHEIASGVTSSVAQELIGYRTTESNQAATGVAQVINYASGDVSSWNDIHHLAERLVFFSDSPGLMRYAKSTIRALTSWEPHWTVVCVAANSEHMERSLSLATNLDTPGGLEHDADHALTQLDLCVKIKSSVVIVITKLDLATRPALRLVLGRILSLLKDAGRKPLMLTTPLLPAATSASDTGHLMADLQCTNAADEKELAQVFAGGGLTADTVPIVLTSSVTGAGIGKLHALLRCLPFPEKTISMQTPESVDPQSSKLFRVDEVFTIPPSKVYSTACEPQTGNHGVVLCGHTAGEAITIGDILLLGPFVPDAVLAGSSREEKLRRSSSYAAHYGRSHSGERILVHDSSSSNNQEIPVFMEVRVISLRNLRLPVSSLLPDQVGTIGVELAQLCVPPGPLTRARKGMVLVPQHPRPKAYRTFVGKFSTADFTPTSSPALILGGQASVYINTVRAAAKVTGVALADHYSPADSSSPSPTNNVFDFESDDDQELPTSSQIGADDHVSITFRFVSTIEWMQVDDRVLVVPTAATTGPVAGTVGVSSGLSGFVGVVEKVVE